MQVKKGFKLNQVCGEAFLVPMGDTNIDFSELIALNETSLLLWKRMEQAPFTVKDLVDTILKDYEVDEETATKDIENLIAQFKSKGIITE